MKLFINRDNSASDVCFVIYDELGMQKYFAILRKPKYTVKKNSIKIDITDTQSNVIAKIRQLTNMAVNSFSLKNEKETIRFVMLRTQTGVQCRFYGKNWHICGNAMSKNFSIIDVDNAVISSQSKHNSGYQLEIPNEENALTCLEVSICINMINTVDKLVTQAV